MALSYPYRILEMSAQRSLNVWAKRRPDLEVPATAEALRQRAHEVFDSGFPGDRGDEKANGGVQKLGMEVPVTMVCGVFFEEDSQGKGEWRFFVTDMSGRSGFRYERLLREDGGSVLDLHQGLAQQGLQHLPLGAFSTLREAFPRHSSHQRRAFSVVETPSGLAVAQFNGKKEIVQPLPTLESPIFPRRSPSATFWVRPTRVEILEGEFRL